MARIAETFMVASVATMAFYYRKYLKRAVASELLIIGDLMFEAVGVVGRRAAVSHPMTPAQVTDAQAVVAANVAAGYHADDVLWLATLPADWRYPVAI